MNLNINPKSILRSLASIIILLLIANLSVIYLKLNFHNGLYHKIIKLFDFNSERNLPTFFSALILLVCGILLYLIALQYQKTEKNYLHWLGLATIFGFLSLDEMISIHEQLRAPIQGFFETDGLLNYAWYIPYGIILFVISFVYIKFLSSLSKRTSYLFVVSGVIYVSGAIGVEALSGWYDELYGKDNFVYHMMYTFEELLEMTGVIIFMYSLLVYISNEFQQIEITLESDIPEVEDSFEIEFDGTNKSVLK